MSNIKWGCVQPLTGGMYLGTEKAVGHPADWIISYPGLTDISYDKNGVAVDAGNERNIVDYLVKHNRMPTYYTMNRTMTQYDEDYNPVLTEVKFDDRENRGVPNNLYQDIDLVIGVPVCAGLSMASTASNDRKNECNGQMKWMAKYVLNTIKPKVYIFENAPTLMSARGDETRADLEEIAEQFGYSIVYYKTDTKYHHNCQKRPRTFIMFFNNRGGEKWIPQLQYNHDVVGVEQFFNELDKLPNDPMNIGLDNDEYSNITVHIPIKYAINKFGENWRDSVHGDIFAFVGNNTEEHEPFMAWVSENYDEKTVAWYNRYLNHINDKLSQGLGYWSVMAKHFANDSLPACMYKNVPTVIHYTENRLYTMREWLHTMGHPNDFNMVGDPKMYFRKIGQNVPVNTAHWVSSEAIRIINNWNNEQDVTKVNDLFDEPKYVAFYDNTKQKRIY